MKTALILAAAAFAVAVFADENTFDGTQWEVEVVPTDDSREAGAASFLDTLTFTDGYFRSAELEKFNFDEARYQEGRAFGQPTWIANQRSSSNGMAFWNCYLDDDLMRGRLRWQTRDGKIREYEIRGKKL
jgi:hypothetical protein